MTTRFLAVIAALVGGLACLSACSANYSAAPVTGQVVDAETGKPVAGVNVVAHWQFEGGMEGGTPIGAVMVMEAETDANGRYHFPAWGPKQFRKPFGVYANARIKGAAPELIFFKSAYLSERERNDGTIELDPAMMRSVWDGKTIKLQPFRGTSARYATTLWGLSSELSGATASINPTCSAWIHCPAACQWQNIPKMIRAVGRQYKAFEAEGIRDSSIFDDLIANEAAYRKVGCASTTRVLGGGNK